MTVIHHIGSQISFSKAVEVYDHATNTFRRGIPSDPSHHYLSARQRNQVNAQLC